MATHPQTQPSAPVRHYTGLGASSLALGLCGLAFCWLMPLGAIFSAAGLFSGMLGWFLAMPARGRGFRLAVWGTLLCAFALVLDLMLGNGWLTRVSDAIYSG